MWIMPEIKPLIQNNLPQLADRNITNKTTAAPSDIAVSENPKPPTKLEASKKQSNFIFKSFQLGGLAISLPLIFPSLLVQAENITKYGEKGRDGFINFISSVIDVITSPLRFVIHKIFKNDHDENDVTANKRSFAFDDFLQRVLHPNFVREISSTLFSIRRTLFNFFPKVFITPSEELEPNNTKINKASKGLANVFYAGSSFAAPIRWLSSLATLFTTVPSYLTGTFSSYFGNQKIFEMSKYFSKISDLFTPITSNLSSLFSSSRALYDSSKGESLKVTFARYNINMFNVIQGIVGGVLAIPGFLGAITKAKDLVLEQTHNSDKYKFSQYFGEITASLVPTIKKYGLLENYSEATIKNTVENFIQKTIENSKDHLSYLLDSFYNSSAITRKIFSLFKPVDGAGKIINRHDDKNQLETNTSLNFSKSGFSKKFLFQEIHSLLHPIQSLIMLLPAAYTPISDDYITNNGKLSIRLLDRIMGISSFILSIPNYLIYALSTRIPQVIIKYFELKQKSASSKGIEYDAFEDFKRFKTSIQNSGVPGIVYLTQVLSEMPIDKLTFYSYVKTNKILDDLEAQAQDQEPSNKATELIETFRIGAKALLATRNPLFFAERDDKGYTAEEHNRMKVYQSLGTFKEGIGRIPVIGIFISPLIELLRSRYYVKPRKGSATGIPGLG
jgi:hypothetical protein